MPLRIFHAGELDAWNTPGIIDQNMNRAKTLRGFFYQTLNIVQPLHIAGHREYFSTGFPFNGLPRLGNKRLASGAQHDPNAFLRQSMGHTIANAIARAGHNGNFTAQTQIHRHSSAYYFYAPRFGNCIKKFCPCGTTII